MDERRKSDRIAVAEYLRPMGHKARQFVQVGNRKDGKIVGHIVDFSLTGFKLISDVPFDETKVYELRADFPAKGGQSTMVAFDAQCKWCKRREDKLYDAGFSFFKLTEEEAAHLRALFRTTG